MNETNIIYRCQKWKHIPVNVGDYLGKEVAYNSQKLNYFSL